jgi:putative flavoprotein involved in K+ transport
VVLAAGACNRPVIPNVAALPASVTTLTPMSYRGAGELADRGVLIVGASATGVQLAEEIQGSGRPVTLAVGEHVRLPRRYRGRDVFWWMENSGVLDQRYDEVDDLVRARHVPSPQLIGTPGHVTLDLNTLRAHGVRIAGRLGAITDGVARFSGSLPNLCALADLKLNRLLDTFDSWATANGLDDGIGPAHRFPPTAGAVSPLLALDLRRGEIGTIIWACGYRPDYSWLQLPVLDRRQQVNHDGGVVTGAPGVYLLGTPFLRRRRSSFINGAEQDSRELGDHLHHFLAHRGSGSNGTVVTQRHFMSVAGTAGRSAEGWPSPADTPHPPFLHSR